MFWLWCNIIFCIFNGIDVLQVIQFHNLLNMNNHRHGKSLKKNDFFSKLKCINVHWHLFITCSCWLICFVYFQHHLATLIRTYRYNVHNAHALSNQHALLKNKIPLNGVNNMNFLGKIITLIVELGMCNVVDYF